MSRIEKIIKMIAVGGKDSFLQHALALEYIKIGKDADAQEQFTQLLAENPAYVGSYYHLGKLLERVGQFENAIETYEKGMLEAKKAGDQHAYNELMGARDELVD
jgi:tetratricopeptide (TPR) repeat protein